MPELNKYLIGDSQLKSLEDRIQVINNGVDLRLSGYDVDTGKSIVCSQNDAVLNRALFWLTSKKEDFVRNPGHGGVLYDLVGIGMSNLSLESWESSIKDRFNKEFSSELSLLYLKLTGYPDNHKIKMDLVVQDTLAKRNYQFSLETDIG